MKKTELKKMRADLILLGVILVVGLGLLIGILINNSRKNSSSAIVQVSVGGEVVATFPLNKNTGYQIESKSGGYNHLVIQDGEAWVTLASCPDSICMHMGKISHNGESIICIPNEVVIEVIDEEGENGSSDLDATAGGRQ